MRKKIVVYYGKSKTGPDPFFGFAHKKNIYYYFFKCGKKSGFDMYLASGKEGHLGELNFKNPLFFNGTIFEPTKKIVCADAVYDRSGGLNFPPPEMKKVLNAFEFKLLCNDKNSMYSLLENFMPKSVEIKNQDDLNSALQSFSPKNLAVIKPANGLGGKGIFIDRPNELSKIKLEPEKKYVLQQFIDTTEGIKNITKNKHDLRIIIIAGEIIMAHIRTPREGSYLANVAQGGKIAELPLEKIPAKVLEATRKIQNILDKKYGYPLYSIDFGLEKNKPYVFELNDTIGLPSEKMPSHKLFIEKLLLLLKKIATE